MFNNIFYYLRVLKVLKVFFSFLHCLLFLWISNFKCLIWSLSFILKIFFFKCLDPCLSIFIYEGDIKAPIESSANWWMNNKIQYSHRIEYRSTVKRVHATTWMSLENIMLKSERSQLHKITYCVSPFIWSVQRRQICRDRKQISATKVGGRNKCKMSA